MSDRVRHELLLFVCFTPHNSLFGYDPFPNSVFVRYFVHRIIFFFSHLSNSDDFVFLGGEGGVNIFEKENLPFNLSFLLGGTLG